MARTRARAKGRLGGEADGFPFIPESVMRHPACATLPHAAFRVLCILVVGKAKHRNGTLACSESYAAQFGITSSDTLARSLKELQLRGLVEVTRRVQKLRRFPALYAVTWWPVCNRDGQPVDPPDPASHAYANWQDHSEGRSKKAGANLVDSLRSSEGITPFTGVVEGSHHSDLPQKSPHVHSDGRRNSQISDGGAARRRTDDNAARRAVVPMAVP